MAVLFKHRSVQPADRQPVVLGMDGGGTKTEVLITDLEGKTLSSYTNGPTNLTAVSEAVALDNLEQCLNTVFRPLRHVYVKAAVIGMAGIDTVSDRARFHPFAKATLESFGIGDYVLLNDSEVALANGSTAADALVLIAGTGSVCFGRNQTGKTARAGGMDYLLADEGSGYWIGRKVLRAVVRAYDGRGMATALTPLLLKHFAITDVSQLKQKVYQPQLSKMGVAELAKVWEEALKQGDEVAKVIQQHIIDKLTSLVEAVARALAFADQPFDLVLSGSIAQLEIVAPLLRERLVAQFPRAVIIKPTTPPVHGAIKLALKVAAGEKI